MAEVNFGAGLRARVGQTDTAAAGDIDGVGRAPALGAGCSADGPDQQQNRCDDHGGDEILANCVKFILYTETNINGWKWIEGTESGISGSDEIERTTAKVT
jgi:hypothetical protein